MDVYECCALTSLNGLDNLETIGAYLRLFGNSSLTSLSGIDNLNSIGGKLQVLYNDDLISLSGLDNLDYSTITNLIIGVCPNLSICEINSICEYIENGGPISIYSNAPGCDSVAEIEAACL